MISMIGHAIFGLIVGLCAGWLLPGPNPRGLIVTALIGMAGGWLGGFLGKALGWYKEGEAAGFLMSVVGAMALFVLLRFI
jgi:uncharacterized membrane protein YeaQ/YmgE (transglycosylase-associated protein family)